MIDTDTCAAGAFVREVRSFSDRIRPWDVAIRHHVLPDEVRDPTLVSQRVYGRRDEFLAVMAGLLELIARQQAKQASTTGAFVGRQNPWLTNEGGQQ